MNKNQYNQIFESFKQPIKTVQNKISLFNEFICGVNDFLNNFYFKEFEKKENETKEQKLKRKETFYDKINETFLRNEIVLKNKNEILKFIDETTNIIKNLLFHNENIKQELILEQNEVLKEMKEIEKEIKFNEIKKELKEKINKKFNTIHEKDEIINEYFSIKEIIFPSNKCHK